MHFNVLLSDHCLNSGEMVLNVCYKLMQHLSCHVKGLHSEILTISNKFQQKTT